MIPMTVGEVAFSRLIDFYESTSGIVPPRVVEASNELEEEFDFGMEEALLCFYELTGGIVPLGLVA